MAGATEGSLGGTAAAINNGTFELFNVAFGEIVGEISTIMKRELRHLALATAFAGSIIIAGPAAIAQGQRSLSRIIETQSMLIRHTATKVQRDMAEQNARAYMAQLTAEKKTQLKKKKVKYLAVPTVRSKETAPDAKEVLMIWDIPREALVGKTAYELSTTPKVGTLATYDDLVAEYIAKPTRNL